MRILAAALFCFLCGLYSWQAQAQVAMSFQVICVPPDALRRIMKKDGFAVSNYGVEKSGDLTQVWRNGDKYRVTSAVVSQGLVCMVFNGFGWQAVKPKGTES